MQGTVMFVVRLLQYHHKPPPQAENASPAENKELPCALTSLGAGTSSSIPADSDHRLADQSATTKLQMVAPQSNGGSLSDDTGTPDSSAAVRISSPIDPLTGADVTVPRSNASRDTVVGSGATRTRYWYGYLYGLFATYVSLACMTHVILPPLEQLRSPGTETVV